MRFSTERPAKNETASAAKVAHATHNTFSPPTYTVESSFGIVRLGVDVEVDVVLLVVDAARATELEPGSSIS